MSVLPRLATMIGRAVLWLCRSETFVDMRKWNFESQKPKHATDT
jgi:hypothetical protein